MGYLDERDDDEQDLPASAAQPAPVPAAPPVDFSKLFDPKAMADEDQKARDQRQSLAAAQAITNAISNQHSAGEFALGRVNAPVDTSAYFNALQQNIPDPWERRKALLSQYQTALGTQKAQQEQQDESKARDPNSVGSQILKGSASAAVGSLLDGAKTPEQKKRYSDLAELINDPSTSQADIKSAIDKDPFLKDQFTSQLAGKREEAQARMWNARIGAETRRDQSRENMQSDRVNLNLAHQINADPAMVPLTQSSQKLDRAISLMNSNQPFTPQTFNLIQQDIASSLAAGSSNAASEQSKKEFEPYANALTDLSQKIQAKQIDLNNPQLKAQMLGLAAHLKQTVDAQKYQRAQQLGNSFQLATPLAEQNKKRMIEGYAPQNQAQLPGESGGADYHKMSDAELDAELLKRAQGVKK